LSDYVHYVGNGQEAIETCIREAVECADLNQELVTIVILDHMMPIKTGKEAFREIRGYY
jgi:CheY-like chemotaxis protein